jgi:hypothetical protein
MHFHQYIINMKNVVVVIIAVLFAACGSNTEAPSNYFDVPEFELNQVFEFQEDDEFFLGRPFLASTDGHGNVFVADMSKMEVYRFNAAGERTAIIATRGEGPGEVNAIGTMQFSPNRDLFVYELSQRRLSKFEFTGGEYVFHSSFIATQVSERFAYRISSLNEDFYIGTFNRFTMDGSDDISTREAVHLLDVNGTPNPDPILFVRTAETVFVDFNGNQFALPRPYTGRTIIEPEPDGTFLEVWTDELKFNRYNQDGELLHTFGLPFARPPVTDANREFMANSQSPITQQLVNHLPEFKSVVNTLFVATNGDIWVHVGEATELNWVVFNAEGNAIRRLNAPEGVRLSHADATTVYGTNADEAALLGYSFTPKMNE